MVPVSHSGGTLTWLMLIIFDRRIRTIILVPHNQGSSICGVSSCVIAVKKHSVVTPKAHRYIEDNVLVN